MVSIVVSIHVIVCVAMCIIILLQQGKGAEVGAVFGGSSQTVFGASGAGNALTKATWTLAIIFFASSIFLALASARRVTGSIFDQPFSSAPVERDAGVEAGVQERASRGAGPGRSTSRRSRDAVVGEVVEAVAVLSDSRRSAHTLDLALAGDARCAGGGMADTPV